MRRFITALGCIGLLALVGCGPANLDGNYDGTLEGGCSIDAHEGGGGNHTIGNDGQVLVVSVDAAPHRIDILGCKVAVDRKRSNYLEIGPNQKCPSPAPEYEGQVLFSGYLQFTKTGGANGVIQANGQDGHFKPIGKPAKLSCSFTLGAQRR